MATDHICAGPILVAEKQGSTVNYLHGDLLGSPVDGLYGSTNYMENYKPWGEKLDNPIQSEHVAPVQLFVSRRMKPQPMQQENCAASTAARKYDQSLERRIPGSTITSIHIRVAARVMLEISRTRVEPAIGAKALELLMNGEGLNNDASAVAFRLTREGLCVHSCV